MSMPKLRDSVVVITGASAGIGRATAHEFASKGATVVLAARREEALQQALAECERLGGRGMIVPTDVSDARQVENLAETAVETYGRIDVWVNNAAISLFGRLEETPREDYERVIHTNLFGYINGSREAIRQFREQGNGRLINISSMVGHTGQPFVSAYVTTKWAIRGLTESLRMELADAPDIIATTILPAAIDTPIYQQAGNYTGHPAKAMTPVYPPEQVARAIVRAVRFPRREVIVGNAGRMMAVLRTVLPPLGERMMTRKVITDHFREGPPADYSSGSLYHSSGTGSVRGGWIESERPHRDKAKIVQPAVLGALALSAVALVYHKNQKAQSRWLS